MRLVDADALMTWFNNHYDDESVTVGFVSGLIKDAPTIEPEPSQVAQDIATIIENEKDMRVIGERKRGRKINQHQYPAKWICSECGAKHFNFDDNFCSKCGADVRKRAKC